MINARNATVQPINKATYVVAEKTDSIFFKSRDRIIFVAFFVLYGFVVCRYLPS